MKIATKKPGLGPVWLAAGLLAVSQAVGAPQVSLDVALDKPLMLAGERQFAYVQVGLRGFPVDRMARRAPLNAALVLDKSGSMTGLMMDRAKNACLDFLQELDARDVLSVVTYADTVDVVLPATKLTDKVTARIAIQGIRAGGATALFAGVSKGVAEVRKHLSDNCVNRVILLSDGLANEGPSSPGTLADLGTALAKDGISVTTIGLGLDYNEDLMVRLARNSDGNHAFVRDSEALASVFDYELRDVLSVVAQKLRVRITCAEGVQPLRLMGRDSEIVGRTVDVALNQLYGDDENKLLLEVAVPPGAAGVRREVVSVSVTYINMSTGRPETLTADATAQFTETAEDVEDAANTDVAITLAEHQANQRNREALRLLDAGLPDEAKAILSVNDIVTRHAAERYDSEALRWLAERNLEQLGEIDSNPSAARKSMRNLQNYVEQRQTYYTEGQSESD
jgi:Ca-activated chloride channel family protein